uniref:Uncharacterized protein n=1 Tax=Anguilla anguilla TaxID=7936 RepID=A0A0E9QTZ7_ANGAN
MLETNQAHAVNDTECLFLKQTTKKSQFYIFFVIILVIG